ncbi:hypothetical protein [Leptospira interrogans]|uniref:hypothetical protein n=2 Tax=Leptospira interrogans TaxID=173 RepID=UPI00037688B8|nr:hypothetical protein [Leptospira interrogans]MBM2890009.1 hypothetical protein [Leptospira interrogans]QOI36768.1 hypothetical protein LeptoLang_21495 [Leptospira interrogans serovar Icterohaemorrhagiae]ULG86755.1 hypothetical protein FH594_21535 [Leptospira interrogans]UMQ60509.1 hypothetical protein FH585_21550 [Leptospira interrogans]
MRIYAVGELYSKTTKWKEGSRYLCRQGIHELLLFYKNPTEREINAVRKGEAKFANTGIIKAQRARSFSEDFANKLEEVITRQFDNNYNQVWYNQNLKKLYTKYKTTDMVVNIKVYSGLNTSDAVRR